MFLRNVNNMEVVIQAVNIFIISGEVVVVRVLYFHARNVFNM